MKDSQEMFTGNIQREALDYFFFRFYRANHNINDDEICQTIKRHFYLSQCNQHVSFY